MRARIIYHDFLDPRCSALGERAALNHYYEAAVVTLEESCFQTPIDSCEYLFERFNVGDHGGKHIRSMCVGDMIQFRRDQTDPVEATDGRHGEWGTYICKPVGWERVRD